MITCPECGTKMLDSARSCPMCGLSIEDISRIPAEEAIEPEEEIEEPEPEPVSPAEEADKRQKWLEEQRQIQMELLGLTQSKDVKRPAQSPMATMLAQAQPAGASAAAPAAAPAKPGVSRPPMVEPEKRAYWDKLEAWAQDGIKVSKLEGKMGRAATDLEPLFDEFEANLKKMNELWLQVQGLDTDGLEDEVAEIEDLIKDPDELITVRKKLLKLRGKIAKRKEQSLSERREDDKRKILIERRISQWRSEGFDVSSIEAYLESDIEQAWKQYTKLTNAIKEIKTLREDLDRIDTTGREAEVDQIKAMMQDPDRIDEIVAAVKQLAAPVDKRAELLRRKIAIWRKQGYVVTRLEKLLDGDLKNVSEELQKYEQNIQDLQVMREELEKMDITGYEDKFQTIIDMMNDPDNIFQIAREIQSFLRLLEERETQLEDEKERDLREEIGRQMRTWADQGYLVDQLEEAYAGDLETLMRVYDDYKTNIPKLEAFRERLEAVNLRGFEDEVEAIMLKLNDPFSLDDIEPGIKDLESRVEAEKEGRLTAVIDEFNKRLDEWKADGYIVKRLEEVIRVFNNGLKQWKKEGRSIATLEQMIESDLKVVWEEFNALRADIGTLQEYSESLEKLKTKGFESEYDAIASKLNDPDRLDEIEQDIESLETAIKTAEEERKSVKDSIPDQLKTAKRLRGKQQYEEALELYSQILELDPSNSEAKFFKKKCELNIKKMKREAPKEPAAPEAKGDFKGDPNCASCHGTGKCHSCRGSGKCYWCSGSGQCDRCEGTGKDQLGQACTSCGGSGTCHWCKKSGSCYWCSGTGRCDRCSSADTGTVDKSQRVSKVPEEILLSTAQSTKKAAKPSASASTGSSASSGKSPKPATAKPKTVKSAKPKTAKPVKVIEKKPVTKSPKKRDGVTPKRVKRVKKTRR